MNCASSKSRPPQNEKPRRPGAGGAFWFRVVKVSYLDGLAVLPVVPVSFLDFLLFFTFLFFLVAVLSCDGVWVVGAGVVCAKVNGRVAAARAMASKLFFISILLAGQSPAAYIPMVASGCRKLDSLCRGGKAPNSRVRLLRTP